MELTDLFTANLVTIENEDVETDELDQSAVPGLLPEDTEMETLHSHVIGEERVKQLPVKTST